VAVAQGKFEEAAANYAGSLAIRKKLASGDPSNIEWQRDLSISYNKLGNVALAQSNLDEAARNYGEDLAIAEKLAARDPSNADWQRDIAVSCVRLADLAVRQENPNQARRYGKQAFDALSGIEKRGLHLSPGDRKILDLLRKMFADQR